MKLVGFIEEIFLGIAVEVILIFFFKVYLFVSVNGVMNVVFVEFIGIGEFMYYGLGVG